MRTEVETKLHSGYYYQITGHFQSINVAIGKLPVFHLWPGGHADIALVRAPAHKFRLVPAFGAGRTASGFTDPPDCVDCGVDGKPTPLSCRSWTWTFPDLDYVVDDGHGGCRLGTVS